MTRTKMTAKTANVAVQIPVFTAKMVRRCKMCAVLVDQHLVVFSRRQDISAYFAIPVMADRVRTSKYVKAIAIKTSTAAARARDEMTKPCPPDTEVINSELKEYSYREETVGEHSHPNNLYASGSE